MDFDVVSLRVKIFLMEIPVTIPSPDAAIAMRDSTLGQMEFARKYTLGLLADVPEELWQREPQGTPTHFAWQIGHLAVAQYGLMLFRQRGRAEGDVELMPGWFRKRYSRGTKPSDDPSPHPDRQTMLGLLEPTEMPYAAYPIKLGALLFCPLHESIHSGQIGLLRRAFGLSPIR